MAPNQTDIKVISENCLGHSGVDNSNWTPNDRIKQILHKNYTLLQQGASIVFIRHNKMLNPFSFLLPGSVLVPFCRLCAVAVMHPQTHCLSQSWCIMSPPMHSGKAQIIYKTWVACYCLAHTLPRLSVSWHIYHKAIHTSFQLTLSSTHNRWRCMSYIVSVFFF